MKIGMALLLGLADTYTPRLANNQPIMHQQTTTAIILHESGGDPLLIHDNTTGESWTFEAPEAATKALRALIQVGDSVDVGLMQVNYANFDKYHLTVTSAFDEGSNIKAGTKLAFDNYQTCLTRAEGQAALDCMLSYYNTGNPHHGLVNGYVRKVRARAGEIASAVPALVPTSSPSATPPQSEPVEHQIDTAIHVFNFGSSQ